MKQKIKTGFIWKKIDNNREGLIDMAGNNYVADAVILGSGAAGMMAGLIIAQSGCSCVILEKGNDIAVSNAARAGGPALAGTRYQQEENAMITPEQLYQHMYRFSRGTVNARLLRKALDKGAAVESIFRENGVELELLPDTYGVGFRARHMFKQGGSRRWKPLADKFEKLGGSICFNQSGEKLVIENGRVCGVLAKGCEEDNWYEYRAKAVLIATGGYLGNPEMIREHNAGVYVNALGSRLSDGTGIRMALEAGGIKDRSWGICANEFGGANHKIKDVNRAFSSNLRYAVCGGLLVNSQGERFMNEQYLSDEPLSIGGEISLREGKFYAVMDEDMYIGFQNGTEYDYYGRPETWHAGVTTHDMPPRFKDTDFEKDVQAGIAVCSDSLKKAGDRFHLKKLVETVKEYNVMCEKGQDELFGKAGFLMRPVKNPPYYIFEYEPSAWCTIGGVKTDASCHLLDADQNVISGVYVAGMDNGSAFCVPYYDNEGAALGVSLTLGILAGEEIVKDLAETALLFKIKK